MMFLFKLKFIIPLMLISGFLSTWGVYHYLKNEEEQLRNSQVRLVVSAARDMNPGDVLFETDLMAARWPVDAPIAGCFSEMTGLIGRVLVTPVVAGEPILASKLAPLGALGGVSSLIPPGMRAITVAVNVVSGVGGFIIPNAKVDILATVNASSSKETATTRIILQDITILAIDQTYRNDDNDPSEVKSVTLLVSPEQAEQLALAANEGKLQLMLRNTVDSETAQTRGVRLTQLISGNMGTPAPATIRRATSARTAPAAEPSFNPLPALKTIEVIRSNVRSEITFNGSSVAQDSTNNR